MKRVPGQVDSHLDDIVRLTANALEARTCALLLPSTLLTALESGSPATASLLSHDNTVRIAKQHSLNSEALLDQTVEITAASSLAGLCARSKKTILISPLKQPWKKIGIYKQKIETQSILAAPIPIDIPFSYEHGTTILHGALYVDSVKQFIFNHKEQKTLEDLATHTGKLLNLLIDKIQKQAHARTWRAFSDKLDAAQNNNRSIKPFRVRVRNIPQLNADSFQKLDTLFNSLDAILPSYSAIYRFSATEAFVLIDERLSQALTARLQSICDYCKLESSLQLILLSSAELFSHISQMPSSQASSSQAPSHETQQTNSTRQNDFFEQREQALG